MLQALFLAKQEEIERSKEVMKELQDPGITPERRSGLTNELDRLTGKVLSKINNEVIQDLNNLDPLLFGRLLKTFDESYDVQVENRNQIERWGWAVEIVDGKKMIYDPHDPRRDDEGFQVKYEPIPMMMVEKIRTVHVCETNREAVLKIKKLIEDFRARCKGEFPRVSIDVILDEKRKVEYEISQINRDELKKENFTQAELEGSQYIRRPVHENRPIPETADDLFRRFDALKDR